jgi:hypothetical protein
MKARRPESGSRLGRSRLGRPALAASLVLIGAGVATLVVHGSGTGVVAAKAVPLGTATVHRGDLIEVQRYHGELSFPPHAGVNLSGPGTVTSLPHVGQIVSDGASVAGVDDRPIGVLFGKTPLYRTLGAANTTGAQLAVSVARANLLGAEASLSQAGRRSGAAPSPSPAAPSSSPARAASAAQAQVGVDEARARLRGAQQALRSALTPQRGPDVALVVANMTALGYYRGAGDGWSAELEDAVRQWQERIGATPGGDVDPGDVLVVSGKARVSAVRGEVGGAPAAVAISLSSLSRVATFRLRNGVPGTLVPGRRVKLSAGGDTIAGRVASVKTSHRSTTVQVAFDQSSALAHIVSTRVTMSVTTADLRNVLTVPTQALLALASGGYALQLPGGRLLAVRTGIVQGEDIEVSGAGVHQGLRVVSVT